MRDVAGDPVPHPDGGVYQHLSEVGTVVNSLEALGVAMRGQLAYLSNLGQAGSELGRRLAKEADIVEGTAATIRETIEHAQEVVAR